MYTIINTSSHTPSNTLTNTPYCQHSGEEELFRYFSGAKGVASWVPATHQLGPSQGTTPTTSYPLSNILSHALHILSLSSSHIR